MDDAERLSNELGPRFTPLIADVTDADSLSRAAATVAEVLDGASLDGLVCNAGISVPGPILHQPLEELDRQWRVNVLGQVATVQAFGSLLGAREGFAGKPGRIVMMSSVSGRLSADSRAQPLIVQAMPSIAARSSARPRSRERGDVVTYATLTCHAIPSNQ